MGRRSKDLPGEPRTSLGRALRDLRVVQLHREGVPAAVIAEGDGRTERQIFRVISDWKVENAETWLRTFDPVRMVEGMFERAVFQQRAAAQLALDAGSTGEALTALKGMSAADDRLLRLMQLTGIMPDDLGQFRSLVHLRQIAEEMVQQMDALEAGQVTQEEVRAFFLERTRLGSVALEVEAGEPES